MGVVYTSTLAAQNSSPASFSSVPPQPQFYPPHLRNGSKIFSTSSLLATLETNGTFVQLRTFLATQDSTSQRETPAIRTHSLHPLLSLREHSKEMGQWHKSEFLPLQRPREEDVKFQVSPENIARQTLSHGTGREGERRGQGMGLYSWSWIAILTLILKCKVGLEMWHSW